MQYSQYLKIPRHGPLLMEIDTEKIGEAVLALLYLTLHDGSRAWTSLDWDAMNRLHEKGFMSNPVGKVKSVARLPTKACKSRSACSGSSS
jgi:hypothetical protein